MEQNIEITRTISATHEVRDNTRGITANVCIADNKTIESVVNGNVATDTNPNAANFSSYSPETLHVNFNAAEGRTAILSGIEAFLNELRQKAETL